MKHKYLTLHLPSYYPIFSLVLLLSACFTRDARAQVSNLPKAPNIYQHEFGLILESISYASNFKSKSYMPEKSSGHSFKNLHAYYERKLGAWAEMQITGSVNGNDALKDAGPGENYSVNDTVYGGYFFLSKPQDHGNQYIHKTLYINNPASMSCLINVYSGEGQRHFRIGAGVQFEYLHYILQQQQFRGEIKYLPGDNPDLGFPDVLLWWLFKGITGGRPARYYVNGSVTSRNFEGSFVRTNFMVVTSYKVRPRKLPFSMEFGLNLAYKPDYNEKLASILKNNLASAFISFGYSFR